MGFFHSMRNYALSFNQKTRVGGSIQTFTNKSFWPLDPREEEICIEDIAHALSNKCRFSGHTLSFYSVAQHSVIVSYLCDPEDALSGLLHDGSEAYLVDLPTPLKVLKIFKAFKVVEDKLQKVIYKKFNLPLIEPANVKNADKIALVTEKRDLMPESWDWQKQYTQQPMIERIVAMPPHMAEKAFLNRYRELTHKNKGF
jgi:hypothetical protein